MPVIYKRFENNYSKDRVLFIQALQTYLAQEELEDIAQTLLLFELEGKTSTDYHIVTDKFISLVMDYADYCMPSLIINESFDIDFLLGSSCFTPLQKQLWELWLVDGLSIDELADHYSVSRSTIYQALQDFKWIAQDLRR